MKKLMMLLAAVALTSLTASAQDTPTQTAPSQTKAGRTVDATAHGVEKGAKKTGHVVKRGAQKTGHAVKKGAKKVGNKAEDVVN
ncbi:hypothetical protein LJ737_08750 [Hymenobacter sp. 15J16-1T3B]|uniref:hypothetical protein n=1 Tax=Hymenobacter sp. 15J16-1T3B TaxID=2886941 RepID=UPI001D1216FB|nr:hypothetical protein [Hymenobacter sp. 15J16-1T3B]MCC3157326.1 hypothetical protein [Hymenobacter sp. 15J16-1T3B]